MLEKTKSIASSIRHRIGEFAPEIGIVLGSGLGNLANEVENPIVVDYASIEGMPQTTVKGHSGKFIFGYISQKPVMVMQGRFHYYEGHSSETITLGVHLFALLGIKTVILSNAAGALNPRFEVGDIMVITDHINFIPSPLIGPNDDELGERFPPMHASYNQNFIEMIEQVAKKATPKIELCKGCYVAVTGPQYETRAEIRYYTMIGGDAVGMSTAPEVIAAVHANLDVLALSLITNATKTPTSHADVLEIGLAGEVKLSGLVKGFLKML